MDKNVLLSIIKSEKPFVSILSNDLTKTMNLLKDDNELKFDMLLDHTAVDRPTNESIELFYQLYSTTIKHKLTVSVSIPRLHPIIPSLSSIWKIAEFQEREVYDMFGVLYESHPDLRRLFLEDDWQGFPLRKDYKDEFMLELNK